MTEPVPHYPSDEPDRGNGGAPDLDEIVGRIIDGDDERARPIAGR